LSATKRAADDSFRRRETLAEHLKQAGAQCEAALTYNIVLRLR
jgi:hypothetical protein